MNRCRHSRIFVASAALVAAATAANAGTLGPTSRGSVSISITIPPHVRIASAAPGAATAGPAGALCLETNGIHDYHVAVLGSEGPALERPAVSPAPLFAAAPGGRAICGEGARMAVIDAAGGLSGSARSPQAPVTLLIIPD